VYCNNTYLSHRYNVYGESTSREASIQCHKTVKLKSTLLLVFDKGLKAELPQPVYTLRFSALCCVALRCVVEVLTLVSIDIKELPKRNSTRKCVNGTCKRASDCSSIPVVPEQS